MVIVKAETADDQYILKLKAITDIMPWTWFKIYDPYMILYYTICGLAKRSKKKNQVKVLHYWKKKITICKSILILELVKNICSGVM